VEYSQPISLLSSRETQVLEYASRGWTNAQIARELEVTVHAVKFHLAATYRKLGVPNRTTAVGLYLRALPISDARPA
jgi:DNA-binding NarL/FixJ family response regulator